MKLILISVALFVSGSAFAQGLKVQCGPQGCQVTGPPYVVVVPDGTPVSAELLRLSDGAALSCPDKLDIVITQTPTGINVSCKPPKAQ